MELINNRYRIIKNLKQNRLYSTYLVSDILDEYKSVQLNLLHSEFVPNSLLEFYTNNFMNFSNIVHENMVKDYKFGVVSFIDNKKAFENQLYFTCEYIENSINIIEFTKNMNVSNIMQVFVEVCKAINYLHLRGYCYGNLNINNVMISEVNTEYKIKLKDFATVELEKQGFYSHKIDETYFKTPKLLPNEQASRETDMYALGVLLLCLLRKEKNEMTNIKIEIEQFKANIDKNLDGIYGFDEIVMLNKLVPILERLLSVSEEYPYKYLFNCFNEINNSLDTNYNIFKLEEIEKLNFNKKIVGREDEIKNILKSYDYMIKYKPVKRIFFVRGGTGSGKTSFLQEIEFQLGLKRADIYSSYSLSSLKDSSNEMWVELLRKLISEADAETIEKYETELLKFFPEIVDRKSSIPVEHLNRDKTKYRLLNRIVGFISESVKNKPSVMIIDNIHLANEFTIETLKYLTDEITKHGNMIMIFSYNDGESFKNDKFLEFIANARERKDADIIAIRDLDFVQSCELIRGILSMPYAPLKLCERIYAQSYGNPLFISEVIKDLYSRKMIYISNETGLWNSEYSPGSEYQYLSIPNSIEQAILNQLKDSDEISHEILEIAAVFSNAIPIQDISKFVKLDVKELEIAIQELVAKGLLCRKIGDIGYVYEISNKVLKDVVYDKLSKEEKFEKHRIAASILEMENELILSNNFDELIMHYEKAGVKEKVKKYCIENAKLMETLKDRKEQIRSLEKAISMIGSKGILEKAEIMMKIAELYIDASDLKKAKDYCLKVENIAKKINDEKLLFRAIIASINIFAIQNDIVKFKECIGKCKSILPNIDYFEGQLELKRLEAFLCLIECDYKESQIMYQETIVECGEGNNKVKGEAYRQLAYIYALENRIEEALDTYKKAVVCLESVNSTRSVLVAYNNIGAIYLDFYQDIEMSLEYFNKIKYMSEENNYPSIEILALINIACIYEMKLDYRTGYEYYKLSLEKALKIDSEKDIFYLYCALSSTCLKLDEYSEAYEYSLLSRKELNKFPKQGSEIIGYYRSLSEVCFVFGDFIESEKYIKKAYKTNGKEESIDKIDCEIHLHLIHLICKDKSSYESSISKIISLSQQYVIPEKRVICLCNAAIILAQREDFKNLNLLLKEAEKSLAEPVLDEVQVYYTYAAAFALQEKNESSLKYLLNALEIAKKIKSRSFTYKILVAIGNYYFEKGNMNFSANYYIEAFEIAKILIRNVPEDYKQKFGNNYNMAEVYNRIQYIKVLLNAGRSNISNMDSEKWNESADKVGLISNDEISKMLDTDVVKDFIGNNEFVQSIRQLYMSYLPAGISNESDILANIGSDTIKNIELIIKYLATLTLATNGMVFIEEKQNELKLIASLDSNVALTTTKHIFDKVKSSGQPFITSERLAKKDNDMIPLSEDLKACICIPIINRNTGDFMENDNNKTKHTNTKSNILGYLYLESDRMLNNFNNNGLEKCTAFVGFLALLMEKHQLKLSASIDKLTGALTRKYLEDALNDEVEKASMYGSSFSIIMYDLDRFKNVNDKFGHQTGDEVLKKVSKIVRKNLERNDMLGRYGGEEFIIILPGKDLQEAALVAEELRKKISKEQILGDKSDITVSMGVSAYPMHGQLVQELVEKADQALYVAKENGRNRCQIWDSGFSNKVKGTNKLNGIISGNAVQDSRNVLAMVELIKLVNNSQRKKEKIYSFLGRIIEIMEAQYGTMLIVKNGEIIQNYGRKALDEEWHNEINYNISTAKSVIESKQGVYMIDWDNVGNHDLITGLPDWYSILVVPILSGNKMNGVLYLSVSTRVKEFGINEFNFINVLSNLVATII